LSGHPSLKKGGETYIHKTFKGNVKGVRSKNRMDGNAEKRY